MGKMFRIGLSNGKSFITIEDKIKHIELYLQIQQTRWGEGLKWDIQIPEQFSKLWNSSSLSNHSLRMR